MMGKYGIRLALAAGLGAALFFAGAMWAGKRAALREAEIASETAQIIQERVDALREEHAAAMARETAARAVLVQDMEELQAREAALLGEIDEAQLTPSVTEVTVERLVEVPGECPMVVANPLGSEFVRLWNDASHSP